MSPSKPHLSDAVHTIAPWIAATAACLLAAILLSQFIDTLHLSMQRGEALRAAMATQGTACPADSIRLAGNGITTRQ
jgi:hypothetical protein